MTAPAEWAVFGGSLRREPRGVLHVLDTAAPLKRPLCGVAGLYYRPERRGDAADGWRRCRRCLKRLGAR